MENYLIVTLGTRDVQINKNSLNAYGWTSNVEFSKSKPLGTITSSEDISIEVKFDAKFPNELQLSSPRNDGETILADNNFEQFEPILCLPIIEKTLIKLKAENTTIDKILLIYTDQPKTEENKDYWKNDTIHFASLVSKILVSHFGLNESHIDEFRISENLTDIDFHYEYFEKKKNLQELLWTKKESIDKVFLLPQGGIDQINQALTLRLIEHFEDNLVLFQQTEGNEEPQILSFPHLFLENIKKHKIKEHLEKYDFGFIRNMVDENSLIYDMATLASDRLNLDYGVNTRAYDRLKDVFFSAKIFFLQDKYGDGISRLYTVFENFFAVLLKEKMNLYLKDTFSNFIRQNRGLGDYLSLIEEKNKRIYGDIKKSEISTRPSRWGYYGVFCYFFENNKINCEFKNLNEIEILFNIFEALIRKRNAFVHSMEKIDLVVIDQTLASKGTNLERLLFEIEKHLESSNFGIYGDIKIEIEKLL